MDLVRDVDAEMRRLGLSRWLCRRFAWATLFAFFAFGAVVFVLGPHAQIEDVTNDGRRVCNDDMSVLTCTGRT